MVDANTQENAGTQPDDPENSESQQPWKNRVKTAVVGAVAAGLLASVAALAQGALDGVFDGVIGLIKGEDDAKAKSPGQAKPPFTVTIERISPWDACDNGSGMVYLKPPSLTAIQEEWKKRFEPPFDNSMGEKSDFDQKYQGQPANYVVLQVAVQGKSDQAVTIQDVKVQPDKVAPAPKALRLKVAGGCGDGSASRFAIDLDSPGQRKVFKAGKNGLGAELVRKFPF